MFVCLVLQHGQSPLIKASSYGHKEICRLLLDRHADVNTTDKVILLAKLISSF